MEDAVVERGAAGPLSDTEYDRLVELEQVIEANFKAFYAVGCALREIRERRLYRASHGTFETYAKDVFDVVRTRAYHLIAAADVVDTIRAALPGAPEQNVHNCGQNEGGDGEENVYNCRHSDGGDGGENVSNWTHNDAEAESLDVPDGDRAALRALNPGAEGRNNGKRSLLSVHRPTREAPVPMNEAQARELAALSPRERVHAWERALATAPDGKITARHVRAVVRELGYARAVEKATAAAKSAKKTVLISHDFKRAFLEMLDQIRACIDEGWKTTDARVAYRHVSALMDLMEDQTGLKRDGNDDGNGDS